MPALLLGTLLGIGVGGALLSRSMKQQRLLPCGTDAVVTLGSLVDVVERTGGQGDSLRVAVASFAAAHPRLRSIRVLSLSGAQLEASTVPEDAGERVAPRRLAPDEKPLFDQGQRLRAAVQTNLDEGAARKEEIEVRPSPAGGLDLAAPFSIGGAMVGIVKVETAPLSQPPRPSALFALLLIAGATLATLAVTMAIGERRTLLTVLSGVIVLLAVGGYGRYAVVRTAGEIRSIESAVVTRIVEEGASATAALEAGGVRVASPLRPTAWDMDIYRRPLGVIGDDATVDSGHLAATQAVPHRRSRGRPRPLPPLARAPPLRRTRRRRTRPRRVHPSPAGLRLRPPGSDRHAPARLLPVHLRDHPLLHRLERSTTATSRSTEIWIGIQELHRDILGDFHIAHQTARGLVFNYQNFYWTLMFTIVWTIANVAIGVTVGLFLALILNTKGFALRPIYRVLLILPWAMPNYITALIWKGMFHQQFGVVNQFIQVFGRTADRLVREDGHRRSSTVLATNGWLSFPFMMVISLGALQSIPADLYEAATGRRRRPLAAVPLDHPAVPQARADPGRHPLGHLDLQHVQHHLPRHRAGEPAHATELLITQAYKFAFEQYRYGYAAAYSTVIFVILLALRDLAEPGHPGHGGDMSKGSRAPASFPHLPLHLIRSCSCC